jgi:hypothetical protein
MKVLRKADMVAKEQLAHVRAERDILVRKSLKNYKKIVSQEMFIVIIFCYVKILVFNKYLKLFLLTLKNKKQLWDSLIPGI